MIRHALIIVSAVVAMAVWAYGINYNTMTAYDRVVELRSEIAQEREQLQVLRVEWAYLNRPERLQALVAQHNHRLQLVPMTPEVLQDAMVVPFPDAPLVPEAPVAETGPEMPVPRGRPVGWFVQ
ncbi:MAG: cell division protein FtsL [Pseudomonadota bacterium]